MIWKPKRIRRSSRKQPSEVKRRAPRPQHLERRELLAADPIHVGVVYLETDYLESDNDVGSDSQGDRFILSFTGGAADTELQQLRIRTDKDGDGISVGDPIFDTQVGGRGKSNAHDFQIIKIETLDGRIATAEATVADGGQELVLNLQNFRAGDRLEFIIDVDEVLRNSLDLAVFNDRLDVITSGQEFQDSILEAVFEAPHYESATADAIFLNDYGAPHLQHGLDLPPDEGSGPDSRPNRSAAAVATTSQTPKPVSISGGVWLDNNLDAIWQDDEIGLAGVELALFAAGQDGRYVDTGHRVQTDNAGRYEFGRSLNLMPGQYRVAQRQPDGLFSVAAVPGSVDGLATGVVTSVDVLSAIQIPLGDTDAIEMNFAEAAPASIGGSVYRDDNDNGVRDAGESGIAGVTVRLVPIDTIADQTISTAITDASGAYVFDGLAPGDYEIIEVTQPVDFVDGTDAAGTIDGQIVGAAVNPGDQIGDIRLGGGDVGIDYNFGELALGELSGYVFLVAPGEDCDGVHTGDSDEPLGGVVVELQTPDGNVISRVTTTPMGHYSFESVAPGTYRIVEYTPAHLIDGGSHVGTIDGIQSGMANDGTVIQNITLTPGGVGVEYNFCEIAPVSLSGYVYHDQSNDGRRNVGEAGIGGAIVTLIGQDGEIVATTATDSDGRYEFNDLPPGVYEVRETQPSGFLDGIDSAGQVNGVPVGAAANDWIRQINLPQGLSGTEYNFGELLPASLSGLVHADLDGDCVRDDDEIGLAGVMIRLLDEGGNEVASAVTNADGIYRFSNLMPGRYTVVQDQPDGYFNGGSKPGSEGGVAGDNLISAIELESGTVATDYNFCEEPPTSLAGSVYVDSDGDCIRDEDERGIAGVTIELRDASGTRVATTTTDQNGDYRFDGLRAGEYSIFEYQPAGYLQGGQTLGSAGGVILGVDLMSVSLQPGQAAVDYLFCEYEPGTLSGTVWSDNDQDQIHDVDEDPISDVTIQLVDENGVTLRTTTTDVQGRYVFDQLPPGVYSVRQHQPDDYFHGGQLVGDKGGVVAEDDLIVGIKIGSGIDASDYSFPEIPPATISGFVFIDGDVIETEDPIAAEDLRQYRDGVFTSDDTPIDGVRIEIRDADGGRLNDDAFLSGDAAEHSVVMTDSDGAYVFAGLRPGTYTLFQTQPADLTDSIDTPGTTGGLAVNAGDQYTEEQAQLIDSIEAAQSYDALLSISVGAGNESQHNNFSEVVIEIVLPPVEPPVEPPVDPPELPPPSDILPLPETVRPSVAPPRIESFDTKTISFTAGEVAERTVPRFIGEVDAVTWHLSVINGGYPRGTIASGGQFKEVAMKRMSENWSEGDNAQGTWRLLTIEGEVHEQSKQMTLGAEDAVALVGDFDGDGHDEAAVYVAGQWFVDLNGNGVWDEGDLWILLGTAMDQPVVGDWDGDGKDDIGIFGRKWERDLHRVKLDAGLPAPSNRSRRYLENRKTLGLVSAKLRGEDRERWLRRGNDGELRADAVDHVFQFGEDVDTPVAGDWNGDGIDQIGTFRGGTWVLDAEGDGRRKAGETTFDFGQPGDRPVVGDFDGDGIDEVGVIRGNTWIIDSDGNGKMTADDLRIELPPGDADAQPIVGDWDGDGKDEPGYYNRAG
ncbi:Serine-aspartate repeat-containing protein D precursor [Stieleria neptunia]|uniref:Serine-aspartate repeat-containing protein D n=1 Tax=Stieleria neptunia TaxID=2527979 RepID=A0A518HQS2_9BACT|nr:SdrD B-like domain-containing protein [Stieleria neptunia]QDV43190.1 Serine-aspartate repeat-containing protein D precursor [Stieleria neptunia]